MKQLITILLILISLTSFGQGGTKFTVKGNGSGGSNVGDSVKKNTDTLGIYKGLIYPTIATVTANTSNISLKKNISDTNGNGGYKTNWKASQDSLALSTAIYDFVIGDGGTNTPVAGTTTYTNTALIGKNLTAFHQSGIKIPLVSISGSAYVTFNNSTGVITAHNFVFSTGAYYSASVGSANITIPTVNPYVVYSTLYAGALAVTTGGVAVSNVSKRLLNTEWADVTGTPYVRFVGNYGLGILSNDVVELKINDITNSTVFSDVTATVPYLTGTTNDPNAEIKVSTPWIAVPSSLVYVTVTAYNQTATRGYLSNLRMEIKYQ